jgi:hypothetical protein
MKMNLTERKIKSIQTKIQRIKKALADDKKEWGGFYDDSRGLRYIPPQLYLEIQDYSGAKRYFNWFHKNFPDDACYPDFLFEWTITLFYCKKVKEAENKAIETFISGQEYFDMYFNKSILNSNKTLEKIAYSSTQEELVEFSNWLERFIVSEKYINAVDKYNEFKKQLSEEDDVDLRWEIIKKKNNINSYIE